MISNQILQSTIEGLKEISRIDFCVIDLEGNVLAATFPESEEYRSSVVPFVDSPADSQVVQGHQFFKIYDELQVEYVLVAKGSSDDVYMIGKMAAFQIQNLLVAYKERFDKDNFIKNLLLDNLLLVDIYNRAKKLHIAANARRVVFLVDTAQEKDNASMECIRSLLGTKTGDFITAVDEKSIIVVKELASEEGYQDFPVNKSVILTDFMNNHTELVNIHSMFDKIQNDKNLTVKGISIKGFASPEGPLAFNEQLSKKRAEALKDYLVKNEKVSSKLYKVTFGGENWDGLVKALQSSSMKEKETFLNIIKNTTDDAKRKQEMKNLQSF